MPDWLTVTLAAMSALFGAGGIAALYKARKDAKLGIRQQDTAEDAAWDARWSLIVQTQAEAIVDPLRGEVTALRSEVSGLRTELGSLRTRYWRSITHIRDLLAWIARHLPDADPPPPVTPADIADDI